MKLRRIAIVLLGTGACGSAIAAALPQPGEHDARVRYITYVKDDVTVVNVGRGVLTRIVLADNEQISAGAVGFPADCAKDDLEWCIRADKGTNQIWVKPKDRATHNNLELQTDKHDYSFEFRVLPDAEKGRPSKASAQQLEREPMYRVIFRYPLQAPSMGALMAAGAAASASSRQATEKEILGERLATVKPAPRNWKYSMQVLKGGEEIKPSMVFDDGRFTYFQFPANRPVPIISYVAPDGEEKKPNKHVEDDMVVVQQTGRKFVLRLGQAVVGVFNEAFDADGVASRAGTTVDGVERTLRQQ